MRKPLIILTAAFVVGLLLQTCTTPTKTANDNRRTEAVAALRSFSYKHIIFAPIAESLLARGMDTSFLRQLLNDDRVEFKENLVKYNVTGYRNPPDYSFNYNEKSVKKAKEFFAQNSGLLQNAETAYHVPKEVLASILLVETKFGTILGKNNVPSVFLSVALANQPEYIAMNKENLRKDWKGDAAELAALDLKIEQQAKEKSGLGNRRADGVGHLAPDFAATPAGNLRLGAGAFGLSQFLPSSYLRWAKDGNADGVVNLFDTRDAVFSIANYLTVNGWGENRAEQERAVFHYNNSKDYVAAVLTLADKLRK